MMGLEDESKRMGSVFGFSFVKVGSIFTPLVHLW